MRAARTDWESNLAITTAQSTWTDLKKASSLDCHSLMGLRKAVMMAELIRKGAN